MKRKCFCQQPKKTHSLPFNNRKEKQAGMSKAENPTKLRESIESETYKSFKAVYLFDA